MAAGSSTPVTVEPLDLTVCSTFGDLWRQVFERYPDLTDEQATTLFAQPGHKMKLLRLLCEEDNAVLTMSLPDPLCTQVYNLSGFWESFWMSSENILPAPETTVTSDAKPEEYPDLNSVINQVKDTWPLINKPQAPLSVNFSWKNCIYKKIGAGNYGAVYWPLNSDPNKAVVTHVIKVERIKNQGWTNEDYRRIATEAYVLCSITFNGNPLLNDVGRYGSRKLSGAVQNWAYVMEQPYAGKTWETLVTENRALGRELKFALSDFFALALVLSTWHMRNIVHGDLSANNVVWWDQHPTIIDGGAAQVAWAPPHADCKTAIVYAHYTCMPPYMDAVHKPYDHFRVDLRGLAIIAATCIFGQESVEINNKLELFDLTQNVNRKLTAKTKDRYLEQYNIRTLRVFEDLMVLRESEKGQTAADICCYKTLQKLLLEDYANIAQPLLAVFEHVDITALPAVTQRFLTTTAIPLMESFSGSTVEMPSLQDSSFKSALSTLLAAVDAQFQKQGNCIQREGAVVPDVLATIAGTTVKLSVPSQPVAAAAGSDKGPVCIEGGMPAPTPGLSTPVRNATVGLQVTSAAATLECAQSASVQ